MTIVLSELISAEKEVLRTITEDAIVTFKGIPELKIRLICIVNRKFKKCAHRVAKIVQIWTSNL